MKNKIIKEYRERIIDIRSDIEKILSFIEGFQWKIDDYYTKYFEMQNISKYISSAIIHKKFEKINDNIYFFSKEEKKYFLLRINPKIKLISKSVMNY